MALSSMSEAIDYYTRHGIIVHPLKRPIPGNKKTGKDPFYDGWQNRTVPYNRLDLIHVTDKGHNLGASCGKAQI
jgi:hypothetical protein